MYTIGQVSELFGIPASTLRYYDKEGLFPDIQRESGIRKFSDTELEALRVIECLKKSGLEIKEVKRFMAWCAEGPSTYSQRRNLFEARKKAIEEQLENLRKTLCMMEFKCWYYDQAIADGNEERLHQMIPDALPAGIQELYDQAH